MVPGCSWGHLYPYPFLDHRSYDVPHPGFPGFRCLHCETAVWHYCAIPHPRGRLAPTWRGLWRGLLVAINSIGPCPSRRLRQAWATEKPTRLLFHSMLFACCSNSCKLQLRVVLEAILSFQLSQLPSELLGSSVEQALALLCALNRPLRDELLVLERALQDKFLLLGCPLQDELLTLKHNWRNGFLLLLKYLLRNKLLFGSFFSSSRVGY